MVITRFSRIQLIFTGISLKEKFVSGVCFYLYARAT